MKIYNYLLFLFGLLACSSCIDANMEDLPEFEDYEIQSVQRVEYRYVSNDVSEASGQNIVKFVTLAQKATIDDEAKTVKIAVTVPASSATFPETERTKCSVNQLAVMFTISTAARMVPLDGAPELGKPGDWSKPNKYRVTAANGDSADWTVEITEFTK